MFNMDKDTEDIHTVVRDVDGWLFPGEINLLYGAAKKAKGRGVILEIGSWKGKSTIVLAKGSKKGNNVKVYAIDPHTGAPEQIKEAKIKKLGKVFKKNIKKKKVNDIIIPIVRTSEEASKSFKEPIEVLFIDGAHEYWASKLDFKLWYPRVINNGFIAMHDVRGRKGPRKVFREKVCKSNKFKNIGLCSSIGYARKVERNSFKDKLRARYIMVLTYVFDLGDIFKEMKLFKPIQKPVKILINKLS